MKALHSGDAIPPGRHIRFESALGEHPRVWLVEADGTEHELPNPDAVNVRFDLPSADDAPMEMELRLSGTGTWTAVNDGQETKIVRLYPGAQE